MARILQLFAVNYKNNLHYEKFWYLHFGLISGRYVGWIGRYDARNTAVGTRVAHKDSRLR